MSIEATADALVQDQPSVAQIEQPQELSEFDELSAVYDNMTEGGETEAKPEDDASPDQPENLEAEPVEDDVREEKPAAVEVPSGLPVELRKHWAEMPEGAREAVIHDREELHRRLSDMGRQVQGIAPIRDVLSNAIQQFPAMANMKPQEAAAQIFELAKVSNDFGTKPIETMMGLIKKHGMEQAISQALGGQQVSGDARSVAAMKGEIDKLNQTIRRLSDPSYLSDQISQITTQNAVLNSVNEFAATAEHWAEVESHVPAYIAVAKAKLGEGAAPRAVLELAYQKAVDDFVDAKAPAQPAVEAQAVNDPERTAKALKATSVNVTGKPTGKTRNLTEFEELSAVYDRLSKK